MSERFEWMLEKKRLRKKLKERLVALRAFTEAYPSEHGDRGWKGILHEEGCSGVRESPSSRDEKCECDGDYLTSLVSRALR